MTLQFQQTRGWCPGLCWGLSVGCEHCTATKPPSWGLPSLPKDGAAPLLPLSAVVSEAFLSAFCRTECAQEPGAWGNFLVLLNL